MTDANTIEERLCRIEAMLTELLSRLPKRTPRVNNDAQKHDDAVNGYAYGSRTDAWQNAWAAYCAHRREKRKYMTERSITALLNKLAPFTYGEQVYALNESVANDYQGVFPKSGVTTTKTMTGEDWFNDSE